MSDLVLMTRRGRLIGVRLYDDGSRGTYIMRQALVALGVLCDEADRERNNVKGVFVDTPKGNISYPIIEKIELHWENIGVNFGREKEAQP